MPELVDLPGARWELLDGEAELAPGVHVISTPGHVNGHQSIVLECDDGSLVLAGRAHDTASGWSADVLASRAARWVMRNRCPWQARGSAGCSRSTRDGSSSPTTQLCGSPEPQGARLGARPGSGIPMNVCSVERPLSEVTA